MKDGTSDEWYWLDDSIQLQIGGKINFVRRCRAGVIRLSSAPGLCLTSSLLNLPGSGSMHAHASMIKLITNYRM